MRRSSASSVAFPGRKGPDVFLRTALAVHASCPDARFVLVGDGPMRQHLETFVARFGLSAYVHLAGTQSDMPRVLGEFDVLVSSSHSEAMPLAIMEAMASGLPVVATRVGGVADLLDNGVTGWLANDGDFEGLATRVVDLLRDDTLRLTAGRAARARACSHFPIAANVEPDGRTAGASGPATQRSPSPGLTWPS